MKKGDIPNPNVIFPVPNIKSVTYVKPTLKRKNIIAGDFTYFGDVDFESHVSHFYDFYGDRLIIGKFCQIASGVEFIMNGANHKMDCVSTFPFYIFEKWGEKTPEISALPNKGDTVVGNDVWIGQNATILAGSHIENGAIIGANAVVSGNIAAYGVAVGNPAKVIKKRFDDEMIELLLELKWWDLPITQIQALIPILHSSDIIKVKAEIRRLIER